MAKPPSVIPKPTPSELEEGEDAIAEAAAVAGGLDLSSRSDLNKLNKLLRQDQMDEHIHRILVWGLYIVAALGLGMFASLAVSMALPAYAPLTDDQIAKLQGFLFSGALGAGISAAAKKVSGSKDDASGD